MKQQCEDDIHDWEYSSWGVIIGVSKCRKCGKVAKEKDFVVSANKVCALADQAVKMEDNN